MFSASSYWFVYLFTLSDCSAFKVGFSCNPLQRLYGFSHRYFERFDLQQSLLLQLSACDDARDIEASLKRHLAAHRIACPAWIPSEAGGHTEWFRAVYLGEAEARLRLFLQVDDAAALSSAADFIACDLRERARIFEAWAWDQAQQIAGALSSIHGRHVSLESARLLKDWLDAYRYFDIPIFSDDAAASKFVTSAATVSG